MAKSAARTTHTNQADGNGVKSMGPNGVHDPEKPENIMIFIESFSDVMFRRPPPKKVPTLDSQLGESQGASE